MLIHTALLSFGMSGKIFHAPFINLNPNFTLVGAWERSKKQIEEIYPNTYSYSSLDEICNDPIIDLVVVNTPNYTHFEYAKKLLLANKNIIVEKCFTNNLAEAIELKNIALQQNKMIAVYHNRRYDSDFLTVQKCLSENKITKIHRVEMRFEKYKLGLNIKKHKEEVNEGSGILKDLGPHIIDQAIILFGLPNQVFASLKNNRVDSLVDDDDFIMLFYTHFEVHIYLSLVNQEIIPAYKIIGQNGVLYKMRSDNQEQNLIEGRLPNSPRWKYDFLDALIIENIQNKEKIKHFKNVTGNYGIFYDLLYDSILNNIPPVISVNDGINVMKIIDACIISNEKKQVIQLEH